MIKDKIIASLFIFCILFVIVLQANDARKELYEKEKEILDLKQEGLGLKQALKDANDQCVLLFNEVQKAWKVSSALQTDLKVWQFMKQLVIGSLTDLFSKYCMHDLCLSIESFYFLFMLQNVGRTKTFVQDFLRIQVHSQ